MIDLVIAAALLGQAQAAPPPGAPDPCYVGNAPARPGCPRWQLVTRDERGARYYDPASAGVGGGQVEVTTRTDTATAPQGVTIVVARMRLDCAARTFAVVHITGYNRDGIRVADGPMDPAPQPVRPGHDAERLLADFCPH